MHDSLSSRIFLFIRSSTVNVAEASADGFLMDCLSLPGLGGSAESPEAQRVGSV